MAGKEDVLGGAECRAADVGGRMLRALAAPADPHPHGIFQMCVDFRQGACQALVGPRKLAPPTASERLLLVRSLLLAGTRLAALNAQYLEQTQRLQGGWAHVVGGTRVIEGCTQFATACQLEPQEVAGFGLALRLVLCSGKELLRLYTASHASLDAARVAHVLEVVRIQTAAVRDTIFLAVAPSPGGSRLAADGIQWAPAQLLMDWLDVVSSTMVLLQPHCRTPGSETFATHLFCLGGLGRVAGLMCCWDVFEAHQEGLARNVPLARRLLDLLLPTISAAAVSLQLPEDRQSARHGLDWQVAAHVAAFVSSDALQAAREEIIAAAVAQGSSGAAMERLSRLLQAAAQLARHVPRDTSDMNGSAVWSADRLAGQLSTACKLMYYSLTRQRRMGRPASLQQQRRYVQCVVPALPVVTGLLRAVSAEWSQQELPPSQQEQQQHWGVRTAQGCISLRGVPMLLSEVAMATTAALQRDARSSLAQLPAADLLAHMTALCQCAAGALRALPSVADALRLLGQLQGAAGQGALLGPELQAAPDELVLTIAQLAIGTVSLVLSIRGPCGDPAVFGQQLAVSSLAVPAQALWELHTVVCRLLHLQAAGNWQWLTHKQLGTLLMQLCSCASWQLRLAKQCEGASSGAGSSADSDLVSEQQSALLSMATSHLEAFHVLAAAPPLGRMSPAIVCGSLMEVARSCPRALALSDVYEEVLTAALQELPQASLVETFHNNLLLTCAQGQPILEAYLVASGSFCALLADLRRLCRAGTAPLNESFPGCHAARRAASRMQSSAGSCRGSRSRVRRQRQRCQRQWGCEQQWRRRCFA